MATKFNSEFNYRYQVQGETIWEKIKTLKGFLVGRKRAAVLEEVSLMKIRAKVSKIVYLKSNGGLEHEILELEAELIEIKSFEADQQECFDLNRDEIKMLERLLEEAFVIAEPSRIPGYTDEQMFEANAANEFTAMIGREIYAEILANGRPSAAKISNAMSNPITWNALQAAGLLPKGNELMLWNNDPHKVGLALPVLESKP
jgi:hypothetical protein